jgi:Fic family protein
LLCEEPAPWPRFRWSEEEVAKALNEVHRRQGLLAGRMQALGFRLQQEAELSTLTEEVLKSSEIEGEILAEIRFARQFLAVWEWTPAPCWAADRNVVGVVDMMLDATQNFSDPLTKERLFAWHAALFPTGRSGMHKITVGKWRTDEKGPMQVTSGAIGHEKVHYEAPAAALLEDEMNAFLDWYNSKEDIDPVIKAALAHLWFVTIHPFEDGKGRIARAITDMSLARSEGSSQRFYSMSAQIRL